MRSKRPARISARAISSDMLRSKAPDSRASKVAVGLQSPRSTLCTMARDTPERAARSVSDQPRFSRSRRTLAPMR
ncbi:hypothetical protein D9M68_929310 [compost metagenome]